MSATFVVDGAKTRKTKAGKDADVRPNAPRWCGRFHPGLGDGRGTTITGGREVGGGVTAGTDADQTILRSL